MSIIRIYNATKGGSRLINLKFVSTIHLENNTIKMFKTTERKSIGGSFLFFGGGETEVEVVEFNTNTEAKEEFDSISKSLKKYYS